MRDPKTAVTTASLVAKTHTFNQSHPALFGIAAIAIDKLLQLQDYPFLYQFFMKLR